MAKRGASKQPRRPQPKRLVVLGGSMGGVEALRTLFSGLPGGLDAAFAIVVHRSGGVNVLPQILSRQSGQPATLAEDGQPLAPGGIYVAPGGRHLRVVDGRLQVTLGPRENGHRPSIDVLFRSAAQSWGRRAIGVVLSGALDCGAVGLAEIKRMGGLAIVQDPKSALCREMPDAALALVRADHVAPPEAIGPLLGRLVSRAPPRGRASARPADERLAALGCPECNGPIWQSGDGSSFRCRVGHRYSAESLNHHHDSRLESALWEALNVMQERAELSQRMAARARERPRLRRRQVRGAGARDRGQRGGAARPRLPRERAAARRRGARPAGAAEKTAAARQKRRMIARAMPHSAKAGLLARHNRALQALADAQRRDATACEQLADHNDAAATAAVERARALRDAARASEILASTIEDPVEADRTRRQAELLSRGAGQAAAEAAADRMRARASRAEAARARAQATCSESFITSAPRPRKRRT